MLTMLAYEWYDRLLRPEILWAIIAVFGIICWTITTVVRSQHRHQERLAMIERGMAPDADFDRPRRHA